MMGGIFDQLSGKLIAVVGMGIIAVLMTIALTMTKSSNIPNELMYMNMKIQGFYAGKPNYADINTALIINAGFVPPNLIKGTAIKNAFNGDIIIAPGAASDSFTFTLTNIPKSECVTLANNKMNSWMSVTINGTTITDDDAAAIVNACTEKSTLVFEAQ